MINPFRKYSSVYRMLITSRALLMHDRHLETVPLGYKSETYFWDFCAVLYRQDSNV